MSCLYKPKAAGGFNILNTMTTGYSGAFCHATSLHSTAQLRTKTAQLRISAGGQSWSTSAQMPWSDRNSTELLRWPDRTYVSWDSLTSTNIHGPNLILINELKVLITAYFLTVTAIFMADYNSSLVCGGLRWRQSKNNIRTVCGSLTESIQYIVKVPAREIQWLLVTRSIQILEFTFGHHEREWCPMVCQCQIACMF